MNSPVESIDETLFACAKCQSCCRQNTTDLHPGTAGIADEATHFFKISRCNECKHSWYICVACSSCISYRKFNLQRHQMKTNHQFVVQQHLDAGGQPGRVDTQVNFPSESDGEDPWASSPSTLTVVTEAVPDKYRSLLGKRKYSENITDILLNLPEATPKEILATLDGHIHGSAYYFVRDAGIPAGTAGNECVGGGPQALVGAAFTNVAISKYSKPARKEDARYQLKFTEHVAGLSGSQVATFMELYSALEGGQLKREHVAQDVDTSMYVEANPIRCAKEGDQKILSGKFSILNQVPGPRVLELGGNAYIPYESIIKYTMAMGIHIGTVAVLQEEQPRNLSITGDDSPVSTLLRSKRIRDLVSSIQQKRSPGVGCDRPAKPGYTCVIPYSLWQDSFDPSGVKKNKGSIKLKTITLLPPPGEKDSSILTFPVALASKGDGRDLDELEKVMADGLSSIAATGLEVWDSQINRIVNISTAHMFNLQDRPERASSLALLGHGGTSTKRFGYICRLGPSNYLLLPSCKECRSRRLETLREAMFDSVVNISCSQCANWSYETESAINLLSVDPVDKYPKTGVSCDWAPPPPGRSLPCHIQATANTRTSAVNSEKPTSSSSASGVDTDETTRAETTNAVTPLVTLIPTRVTFDHLKTTSTFAYMNLLKQHWGVGEARAYLANSGLNQERENHIIELAKKRRGEKDYSQPSEEDLFVPAWDAEQCQVVNHVETPMHLLFLGVTATFLDLLERALQYLHVNARGTCLKLVSDTLLGVKDLSLEWAKALPFSSGKKFSRGPWVSENYMGFARIAKYAMTLVPTTFDVSDDGKSGVYHATLDTAASLIGMLCRLMARTVTPRHVEVSQLWIEEFLSCVHDLDTLLGYKGKDEPVWLSRSNFLGLLNLPDMMRLYGPLRELWEGGSKGEGSIGAIKSHIFGVRGGLNWLQNMLQKIVKERSLKLILQQLEASQTSKDNRTLDACDTFSNDRDSSEGNVANVTLDRETVGSVDGRPLTWRPDRYNGVYFWKDSETLEGAAKDKKPISACRCSDGRLLVPFYDGKKLLDRSRVVKTMEVRFNDSASQAQSVCGCWFSPIHLVENVTEGAPVNRTQVYQESVGFVLLLPFMKSTDHLYYAIDEAWNERNESGGFGPPKLNSAPGQSIVL